MIPAFSSLVFVLFASLIPDAQGKIFLICYLKIFFICCLIMIFIYVQHFLKDCSAIFLEPLFTRAVEFWRRLTFGRRLTEQISTDCRHVIVNQLKLMSASPAFNIDQKIHSMLVKLTVTAINSMHFCCNIFGK